MELGSGSEDDLSELLWTACCPTTAIATVTVPGHGADHLLPVLVSPSLVPAMAGPEALLGTWQSVVLVDQRGQRRLVRSGSSFVS